MRALFAVALWLACFGPKTVICEAWQRVYSCNHWGCVSYPGEPVNPEPTPPWKFAPPQGLMSVTSTVGGQVQWVPGNDSILVPMCVSRSAMCEWGQGESEPRPIPMSDFSLVQQ